MVPRQAAAFVNGSVHQSSSSSALTFTENPLKLEQPKELCICVLRLNIVRRHQSSNPAKSEVESLYGGQRPVGCHGLGCLHVTRVECCRDQGVSLRSSTIFSSPSGNFPPPNSHLQTPPTPPTPHNGESSSSPPLSPTPFLTNVAAVEIRLFPSITRGTGKKGPFTRQ
jgi:hypothetical protein